MTEILVRYAHFLGIIGLSAALISERVLIQPQISKARLRTLLKIDALYGLSAVLALTGGLLLWLAVGKPAEFYSKNGFLHLKLTLFFVIAILSLFPTVFFYRQRSKDQATVDVPGKIRWFINIEILLLLVMPLLGVFLSRGVGLSS